MIILWVRFEAIPSLTRQLWAGGGRWISWVQGSDSTGFPSVRLHGAIHGLPTRIRILAPSLFQRFVGLAKSAIIAASRRDKID